jgi:large subunit ribosomal protein L5
MADKKDKDKAAKDGGKGKDKPKSQQAKPQAPAKSKEAKGAKAKGAEAETSGPAEDRPRDPNYAPRLRTHYRKSVTAALAKKFGYKNPMMVPRLQKVVINMGLGAAVQNPKIIDSAVEDMRAIFG